jgi:hypothetical protein
VPKTILVEYWRHDTNEPFKPGGVAVPGPGDSFEARYIDPAPTYDSGRSFAESFEHDVKYYKAYYANHQHEGLRTSDWRSVFILMSQHGIVGYFVWRVAVDLPEEASSLTLDELFEHYITHGRRSYPQPRKKQ